MSQIGVLRHILNHPLNRSRRPAAVLDYLAWQFRSRLFPGPAAMPFVNDSVLMMRRGMHGATQNIYCGLADFSDMSFLLHLLRPGDLFVDVGANVGSYTVLASAAIGARSIAFEPNPETFPDLAANVHANRISDRVQLRQAGAGARSGVLRFEAGGPQTRIAAVQREIASDFDSQIVTLDDAIVDTPMLIKVDVEGFESDVLAGANSLLARPGLMALIIENNGDCVRYGFAPDQAHKLLMSYGFVAAAYEPEKRRLELLGESDRVSQNSIYLRDLDEVQSRLSSAPPFRVKGRTI